MPALGGVSYRVVFYWWVIMKTHVGSSGLEVIVSSHIRFLGLDPVTELTLVISRPV